MDDVKRAEPDVTLSTPPIPARVTVEGIEFVEFTIRGEEAPQLAQLLKSMGFVHVGNHVSKRVTLWKQGDIRIIMNTEESGFASSAYNMHGTSVCDVGLKVSSASDTAERAKALGAHQFSQPVGPGEMDIPAIRSVGVVSFTLLTR